jgi:hypothetical protein
VANGTNRSKWFKWMSLSVFSALAVLQLTHCAPKDKAKPSASAQAKAAPDAGKPAPSAAEPPAAATITKLVEGIDFSALDNSGTTTNLSAKALYKNLKDKTTPERTPLAMAMMELHLEAAGQTSGAPQQIEKLGAVDALVKKIKAKKIENLKSVYEKLAEMSGRRDVKFSDSALTLLSVLEKNELQTYSGISFLGLLWIQSSDLDMDKALVLFEDGVIKLAELRDKKIMAVSATDLNQEAVDLGTLEEYTKGGVKKAIQLKYFVIHEALKKFAKDPKAWAKQVQKLSNTELKITIPEDKLLQSKATDIKKLNHSELLIGELSALRDGEDLVEIAVSDVPPAKSVPDKSSKTKKKVLSDAEVKAVKASSSMKINSECFSQQTLVKSYNTQVSSSEKSTLYFNFAMETFDSEKEGDLKTLLIVDLTKLDKENLREELAKVNPDLVKAATEIFNDGVGSGRKPNEVLLRVLLSGGEIENSEIRVVLNSNVTSTKVEMKTEAKDLLLKAAEAKSSKDINNIVALERVKACEKAK